MFHLSTLLLITIASKACFAQECVDVTETCSAQEDWKDHFIKGECDKFNEAIAKLADWNVKREEMLTLIDMKYRGILKMAENMHDCLSNMTVGSTFEVYESKMKGFIALSRALAMKNQRATDVSLTTAISMSQISSMIKTTFKSPEKELLEGYVDLYKKETFPGIKSMYFDEWVFIKNSDENTQLAIDEFNNVNMWPIDTRMEKNFFKWRVTERKYRTNIYGLPVIDVIFKNVNHPNLLVADANGGVYGTLEKSKKYGNYHRWTAEFVKNMEDDVKFRLKNKQTGKYLKTDKYHIVTFQNTRVQSMTTDAESATVFNII